MNDLIRLAMERACHRFGGSDAIFNSAGFALELRTLAQLNGTLDGAYVRVILAGRSDVRPLRGGAHWQLLTDTGKGAPFLAEKTPDALTPEQLAREQAECPVLDVVLVTPRRALDPEALGRLVRDEWVAWARERKNAGHDVPERHLDPWEALPEAVREVDRRIGVRIARAVIHP